jgi:hypothetical protein
MDFLSVVGSAILILLYVGLLAAFILKMEKKHKEDIVLGRLKEYMED